MALQSHQQGELFGTGHICRDFYHISLLMGSLRMIKAKKSKKRKRGD